MDLGNMVRSMTAEEWAYDDGVEGDGEREFNMQKTWCHEVGHNLGFEHHPGGDPRATYYNGTGGTHDQDCMVSGHIELKQNWLRYNQHHRDHVAAVDY